jgi:hypothetical protein
MKSFVCLPEVDITNIIAYCQCHQASKAAAGCFWAS